VEVDRDGVVQQASGPENGHNSASTWGAKVLQAWAGTWRPT